MDNFSSNMEELRRYEEVINELEAETEKIESSIKKMKRSGKSKERLGSSTTNSRLLRTTELSPQKKKILSQQTMLAREFLSKRSAFSEAFKDNQNISKLFTGCSQPQFDDLTNLDCINTSRSYISPIQKTLSLLTHSMITSCLVELNLRKSLQDDRLDHYPPAAFLYRERLFEQMKEDPEKVELSELLKSCQADVPKETSQDFKYALFDGFLSSDSFMSKQQRRLDIYLHKSARTLNYETSDSSKSILASQAPVFKTPGSSDDEYMKKLDMAFQNFGKSHHSLKHIDFVLRVTKIISSGGNFSPSISFLRSLLDIFGRTGLYNYQTLVYDALPSYEDLQETLADGQASSSFALRNEAFYAKLIESDPNFLGSLIEYHSSRDDFESLKRVLSVFSSLQAMEGSIRSPLYNKVPLRSKCQHPNFSKDATIKIDLEVIEAGLSACIKMRDFKLMDQLLNKLIFNSITTTDGIKIALNKVEQPKNLLSRSSSEMILVSQVFSSTLLQLLGRTFITERDLPRCRWLEFVLKKKVQSGDHDSQTLLDDISLMMGASRAERSASHALDPRTNLRTRDSFPDRSFKQRAVYQPSTPITA